jgi:hypothetical protein
MEKGMNTKLLLSFINGAIFAAISCVITFLILKFYFKEDSVGWLWVVVFFTVYVILYVLSLFVNRFRKKQN